MSSKNVRKRDPHDPEVIAAVFEDLRTMPIEELDAMLSCRKEGVEATNRNEELAQWYRDQAANSKTMEPVKAEAA